MAASWNDQMQGICMKNTGLEGFPKAGLKGVGTILLVGMLSTPCFSVKSHEAVGFRPTAIPLVNLSTDDGAGYGVRANFFEYDGASVP